MKHKDHSELESIYSKIINESKDIDEKNTDDKHPFNRKDNDPHTGTQKPSTYKNAKVEADEKEENVKDTEEEEFKDVKDKEKEIDEEAFDLLSIALDVIKEAKKKWTEGSKYAICTKTVGREDEAKYKRCKKDVEASHKKSVAKKKKKK
jgi:hypothetical protein